MVILLLTKVVLFALFGANFIGIVCARSLHYQFYSWYFYTLPYLLSRAHLPLLMKLGLFIAIEVCWNIFPSTATSSLFLLACHLILLYGIFRTPQKILKIH